MHIDYSGSDLRRFWVKSDQSGECWEWTGAGRGMGYGAFKINHVVIDAHRFAWLVTNGDIPDGQVVCHSCDNRRCVRPDHLFLGSKADNYWDARGKGRILQPHWPTAMRHPHGEEIRSAKLTEEKVRAIRQRHQAGELQVRLAAEYGIHPEHIHKIIHRKDWAHVT